MKALSNVIKTLVNGKYKPTLVIIKLKQAQFEKLQQNLESFSISY